MEIARVIPRDDDNYRTRLKNALEELCELAVTEGAHQCAVIECEDLVFKEAGPDTSDVPDHKRSIFWPVLPSEV